MNKIYKVIWSKVKHQYVVVSELAHSNGKQSRTSRNSIRSRIAALVVCGAIAAFGVFSALPTSSAYAAAAETTSGQYIAVAVDSNNNTYGSGWNKKEYHEGDTRTFEDAQGNTHNYTWVKVDNKNYWVRDGYTITIENESRFTAYDHGNVIAPEKDYIIDSQKSDRADSEGLISSSQVVIGDDSAHTTLTGNKLNSIDAGIYGGAANAGGTEVPVDYHYYIDNNGTGWVNIGKQDWDDFTNPKSGKGYFQEVYAQKDGSYNTKEDGSGISVSSEYLYAIDKTPTSSNENSDVRLGAFFNSNGTLYTGNVYGHNNEVLLTGVENGTYYSYWGTKINDPNTSLSEMTVGDLEDIIDGVNGSIYTAQGDDIKQVSVQKSGDNGGTIGLIRRGDWNGTAYEETDPVPGTITIKNPTTDSGTNGKDVKIQFGSINEEGTDVPKFTVDAGSKVEGLKDEATAKDGDTLTGIKINGEEYKLGGGETYTAGNGIAIDDENDNKISVRLKDGETNLTVDNTGLALSDNLNVASVTATNNIAANSMSVTNVGDSDNSVVNVGYFNTNEKHIAPTENSSYEASADGTVTLKYADGEGNEIPNMTAKITGLASDSELSSAAAKATTEVVAGKNVKVTPGKDAGDQHNIYTVDAYDTKIQGDSNISVTGGELDSNNVRNYNVKLADVVTIGDSSVEGNNPVKVDGKTGEITGLTNTTLDVNGFAESNRAATEEQLQAAMQDIDEGSYKGWTVSANGENGTTVENGKTVDFSSEDGNVTVTKTTDAGNTKLAFGLADELSVNKVTTSNMYVTNVDKTNDASVVNVGYFNTNEKHIAPTENSSYEASADGTVTLKYADGEGNEIPNMTAKITGLASDSELSSAAAKATTEVVAGKNVKVTPGKDAGDQHNIYTVDAYDTKIQGDSNISVTGGELDSNNVRNYNVKLADVVTIGDSSVEGNHPVEVNGKTGEITGLTNKTLGNGGEDSTFAKVGRAATEEQLQAAMTKIDEGSYKGWNVTTNKGTKTAEVASDGNVDFSNNDKNIIVGQDGTNLTFDLNDNITLGKGDNQININATGTDEENSSGKIVIGQGNKTVEINNSSITLNKSLVIDGSGVNGAIIHGLSNNNWDPKEKDNSTTAATEGQLYDVYDSAVKYDNSDNKATITLEGSDYNGKQGGGTRLTNVAYATGDIGSEAVNVDYLEDTVDSINNSAYKGWTVSANGETGKKVTSNGNVDFSNTDGNIVVGQKDTNLTFDLNPVVTLDGNKSDNNKVVLDGEKGIINAVNTTKKGNGKGSPTTTNTFNFDKDGATFTRTVKKGKHEITSFTNIDGGTITTDTVKGLDNKTINYEGFATEGKAATEEQLNEVYTEAAKHTTVSGDDNLTVNKTQNPDGSNNYQVTLNDNITLGEGDSQIHLNGAPKEGEVLVAIGSGENPKFMIGQNGEITANAGDTSFNLSSDGVAVNANGTSTIMNGQSVIVGSDVNGEGGVVINNNGSGTINGLSNTTWDKDNFVSGQAATEDQLQQATAASKTTLSDGVNTTVTSNDNTPDGHVDYQVNLNDNVYLGGNNKPGSSNIELDGENGTIQVGSNIILDSKEARAVIGGVDISTTFDDIGKKSSTITGLSNTTWDTDKVVIDRAATEGQLQMVSDKVTAGWTATDDAGNKINVNPDNHPTLNFASGKNITVSAVNDEVEVSLNDNINLNNRVYINGDPEEGNNTIVDIKSSDTSKKESIFAVEDKGNGSISIGGIDITNVDGPYLAVGDGKLKFYKDGGLSTGNATGTFSVRPDGDLEISGKNSSFDVDAETGNINAENNSGSSIKMDGNGTTIAVNDGTVMGNNTTMTVNKDGVAFSAYGNGTTVINGQTISAGGVVINNNGSGTINGLTNRDWDGTNYVSGQAATEDQLLKVQQAVDDVASKHTTVSGDENITVNHSDGSQDYQVTLNDNITLGDKEDKKSSTSLTLYTDPSPIKDKDGNYVFNKEGKTVTGYVPESYINDQGRVDDFVSTHGGFMMYATNTSGEGVFGITTDGMVHAKDVISYMPNSDSTSKDKILKYSLNDIGDIVTQIAHSTFTTADGANMEYTLVSDFADAEDKDKPFQTENGERSIGLAVRQDGAVIVGAVVDEKGVVSGENGIRINDNRSTGGGKDTITGLSNTEWKPPTSAQSMISFYDTDTDDAANKAKIEASKAATQGQLDDLYNTVAAYNTYMDANGSVSINYNAMTLRGDAYNTTTHSGGTIINNVGYAKENPDGTIDGSQAVNVDYLNDAINNAVKDGGAISDSDRHLQEGTYHVNDKGEVELIVADEKGENRSTVTIDNIANKNDITNLDNKIDNTFNDLNDRINNIDNVETDVKGGNINEDGTISLKTENEDGTTTNVTLKGQLTDSGVVQEGTTFDKETGTLTITSQDKYSGKTSSVTVDGIASTDVVGVTTKEELADKYKAADEDGNATTEFITDSESMVEADVALDHAIQDVAGTSYANDMVLSNRIDSVEKRLGNVEERIDKVGAMAAAIANLRTMGFDPEAPTEIAIGVGQYKSETGIAIGVFHYPNQDFMLSASLSSSGDELMGGIGATWKLGRKSAAERAKDEEARHLEQAEEMKKLAQQEKVKAQAQRHAKLLAERQQASQKNA